MAAKAREEALELARQVRNGDLSNLHVLVPQTAPSKDAIVGTVVGARKRTD